MIPLVKKSLSILIVSIVLFCLCMSIILHQSVAYAEEGDYGTIHWSLDKKGVLKFDGYGTIKDGGPWAKNCRKVKQIVFGPDIIKMDGNISEYKQLTSVVFFNNIPGCFSGCEKLQEVRFVGDAPVFSGFDIGCCPLKKIIFDSPEADFCEEDSFLLSKDKTILYYYLGKKDKIIIPDGVEIIKPFAFFEKKTITNVSLPSSLKEIGMSAFHRCEKLKTIEIPDSVSAIGACAFEKCTNLKSVSFLGSHISFEANEVDSLGERIIGGATFALCKSLETISLPACELIPESMFLLCSKLKNVYISEGTLKMGSYVFSECSKLEKVFMPDSVYFTVSTLDGIPSSTIIVCSEGSETEKKATRFGYKCAADK